MIWLLVIGLSALALFVYFKFFKIHKIKNIVFIDGSLGTGKSFYSVYLAIRLYKRALRRWKIRKVVYKIIKPLGRVPAFQARINAISAPEEPLLFTNIPLRGVKHVKMTLDMLLRKRRFPYKSVVLLDEVSLMVDQFDYKDRDISDSLRDFLKLFRHETKGGYIVVNSQSTSDLHYSFKAVLSDYLYIHHKTKLPFFSVLKVQEMAYSSDKDATSVVNAMNDDVEENLRAVLVPNRTFKRYDTYCYSILTDGLEVSRDWVLLDKSDSLKTKDVLTFKKGRYKINE